MEPPPTKAEIEEVVSKWKAVIPPAELQILQRYAPPSPSEYIQRGEEWEFLATVRGWFVWSVRKLFGKEPGILTIVSTLIGIAGGTALFGPPLMKSVSDIPLFEKQTITYVEPIDSRYIVFQPPAIENLYTPPDKPWAILPPNTILSGISGQHPMAQG